MRCFGSKTLWDEPFPSLFSGHLVQMRDHTLVCCNWVHCGKTLQLLSPWEGSVTFSRSVLGGIPGVKQVTCLSDTMSCYVALVLYDDICMMMLSWKPQRCSCLCLPSTNTEDMCHYTALSDHTRVSPITQDVPADLEGEYV